MAERIPAPEDALVSTRVTPLTRLARLGAGGSAGEVVGGALRLGPLQGTRDGVQWRDVLRGCGGTVHVVLGVGEVVALVAEMQLAAVAGSVEPDVAGFPVQPGVAEQECLVPGGALGLVHGQGVPVVEHPGQQVGAG